LYEGAFILCARYILFFGIRVSLVEKNTVACSCVTYVSFVHFYADEGVIVKYSGSSLTSGVSAVGKTNALWKTGVRETVDRGHIHQNRIKLPMCSLNTADLVTFCRFVFTLKKLDIES
jgi:hypothetical protein